MGPCLFVPVDDPAGNILGRSRILFTWTEAQWDASELSIVSPCSQQAEFHTMPARMFQLSRIHQKSALSAKESKKTLPIRQQIKKGERDTLFLKLMKCREISAQWEVMWARGNFWDIFSENYTLHVSNYSFGKRHISGSQLLEARWSPRSKSVHTRMGRRKTQQDSRTTTWLKNRQNPHQGTAIISPLTSGGISPA